MRHVDQSISDEIGKDFRPEDGGDSSVLRNNTNEHLFTNAGLD